MPALEGRDKLERELAKAISEVHSQLYKDMIGKLKTPPSETDLDADFWIAAALLYKAAIEPVLEKVYLQAVDQLGETLDKEIDLHSDAKTWATNYADSLSKDIAANRREFVSKTIQKARKGEWEKDQLEEALLLYFSVVNASGIAVTEVTSAVSKGEMDYLEHYRILTGIILAPTIKNDDDPCDICLPKQGQSAALAGYPPFHWGCRCYTILDLI